MAALASDCWDILDFFSETADRNWTKLGRKQDLDILYQVCVFRADLKNKVAALASDWLRHFRLLLWNRWMEFNETLQEARSQRPLPSWCFGAYRKNKMAAWLLIGWDILEFSSETAEGNSTKPYRKQDLNVLYQVCVFHADEYTKMANLSKRWHIVLRCMICGPLGLLFITSNSYISPLKPLNGIEQNLTGSKISMSSTKFVFFGPIGKTRWPPWPLIGLDIFDFPLKPLKRIQRTGSKISTSFTKCWGFIWRIWKTIWPPRPLIGWDIFDFS